MNKKTGHILAGVVTAAAFLSLVGMNLSLQNRVEELSQRLFDLTDNMAQWRIDTDRALNNQEGVIRSALQQEASLFTGLESRLDWQDGGLVLSVTLSPKELRTGETATLSLDSGESVPFSDPGTGRLSAVLPCPLQEEITPTVTLSDGQSTRRETLPTLYADSFLVSFGYLQLLDRSDPQTPPSYSLTFDIPLENPNLVPETVSAQLRLMGDDWTLPGELLADCSVSPNGDGSWTVSVPDSPALTDGLEPGGMLEACLWISAQLGSDLELHSTYPASDLCASLNEDGSLFWDGISSGKFELSPIFP